MKRWLAVIALGLLAGCSHPQAWIQVLDMHRAGVVGNVERGQTIFMAGIHDAPPCAACHQVSSSSAGFSLAPNLAAIHERAATRVAGLSAEQYIEDSILYPAHHIVPGFRVSMYAGYSDHFTGQDVADLVAYLMTL